MDLGNRGQLAGSLGCTDERLLVAQRNPQASKFLQDNDARGQGARLSLPPSLHCECAQTAVWVGTRSSRFLVVLTLGEDLLIHAKHLFVAASRPRRNVRGSSVLVISG